MVIFSHKLNHNRWGCSRWYDTNNTPLYIRVIFGTYNKTIILTHSIINRVISIKILIIREYDTFQINFLTKKNIKRKQDAYFLHKKGWNSGTNPAHVEPLPTPLIEETYNGNSEKYFIKIKLHRYPTYGTLDIYEFKVSLFVHGES